MTREARSSADEAYRSWMQKNLERAAEAFSLQVSGTPVFGWRLRSIGSRASDDQGSYWLRVVGENPRWLPGDFWTGNVDANTLTNLSKPRVLKAMEWTDQRQWRAEVASLIAGHACSPTDAIRSDPSLPPEWWQDLRQNLDTLRATPTARVHIDQDRVNKRTRAALDIDLPISHWETVHGDLHWGNLHCPQFALLDWELWGRGPVGTDAATLYCYSLLSPITAQRVYGLFADTLDMPAGRTAQLYAASRLLTRAQQDYPELLPLLWQLAQRLICSGLDH